MLRQTVSALPESNAFQITQTSEQALVTSFAQDVIASGIAENPHDVIDFYVALKSRPLALVAGPAHQGKSEFVRCLARFFVEHGCARCQMMLGHPWWAGESDNVVLFTRVQSLFTTQKLHYLIEEAWRPENAGRVFIGCLEHISPGELICVFTSLSQQISEGENVKLDPSAFRLQLSWPPNLLLIGTMDTEQYNWWDRELVSKTSVFLRQYGNPIQNACPVPGKTSPGLEKVFLFSAIREPNQAYQKLHSILNRQGLHKRSGPLKILVDLMDRMEKYRPACYQDTLQDAVIYLANAWSPEGCGLFHPLEASNLAIALDRAILRVVLPQAYTELARVKVLRGELASLLQTRYPLSMQFLNTLA